MRRTPTRRWMARPRPRAGWSSSWGWHEPRRSGAVAVSPRDTSGTAGFIRNAGRLSITVDAALDATGAQRRARVGPAEKKRGAARPAPRRYLPTGTRSDPKGSVSPADRPWPAGAGPDREAPLSNRLRGAAHRPGGPHDGDSQAHDPSWTRSEKRVAARTGHPRRRAAAPAADYHAGRGGSLAGSGAPARRRSPGPAVSDIPPARASRPSALRGSGPGGRRPVAPLRA